LYRYYDKFIQGIAAWQLMGLHAKSGECKPYKPVSPSFLSYSELDRNFSSHTLKAYRLDLAQFARFTLGKSQSDDVSMTNQSRLPQLRLR
jgi:site-specific recombinase XerC